MEHKYFSSLEQGTWTEASADGKMLGILTTIHCQEKARANGVLGALKAFSLSLFLLWNRGSPFYTSTEPHFVATSLKSQSAYGVFYTSPYSNTTLQRSPFYYQKTRNMSEHNYKFNVAMSCSGCSGAVERVLKRLDGKFLSPAFGGRLHPRSTVLEDLTMCSTGVKTFDVNLEKQTAEIVTQDDSLDYNTVLSTIAKTGKKVNSGQADGEDMPVAVPAV
jgi:copper chaperone